MGPPSISGSLLGKGSTDDVASHVLTDVSAFASERPAHSDDDRRAVQLWGPDQGIKKGVGVAESGLIR